MLFLIYSLLTYVLGACSDNPFLDQFLNLINNLEMNNVTLYNTYVKQTPSAATLTICTQMSSQSCCTTEMESYFSQIVIKFQAKLLDNQSQLQQLLNQFEADIAICGLIKNISFESSLIGQDTISNYKAQLKKLAELQAGFLQGNLCILCTTPENTTFIQNNKIVAQKSNYDTYIASLLSQYEALQSLVVNFRQYILLYYVNYTNTLNCSSTLENFLLQWQNVVVCPGNDCGSFIHQTIQPLGYRQLTADDYYTFSDIGLVTYIGIQTMVAIAYVHTLSLIVFILL